MGLSPFPKTVSGGRRQERLLQLLGILTSPVPGRGSCSAPRDGELLALGVSFSGLEDVWSSCGHSAVREDGELRDVRPVLAAQDSAGGPAIRQSPHSIQHRCQWRLGPASIRSSRQPSLEVYPSFSFAYLDLSATCKHMGLVFVSYSWPFHSFCLSFPPSLRRFASSQPLADIVSAVFVSYTLLGMSSFALFHSAFSHF